MKVASELFERVNRGLEQSRWNFGWIRAAESWRWATPGLVLSVNRRACLFAIACLIIIVAGFRVFPFEPDGPVYRGQCWKAWLPEFDHYPLGMPVKESQYHAPNAVPAVLQAGTNALPGLVAMLSHKDSQLNSWVIGFLDRQCRVELPFTPANLVQRRAAAAFEVLGTQGQPVVPQLVRLLNDRQTATFSAVALAATGQPAIQPLKLALANSDPQVRAAAAHGLGFVEPPSEAAVVALMAALKDRAIVVRTSAVNSLGRQKGRSEEVVLALTRAVEDPNGCVVLAAMRALRQFGDRAKSALPVLLSRRQEFEGRAKYELEETLKAIDPTGAAQAEVAGKIIRAK